MGKQTPASEYRLQSRGGVGVISYKITERGGAVVGAMRVEPGDSVMLITNKGQVIRLNEDDISLRGTRNTQGVKLIRLNEGEIISSIGLVKKED